MTQDEGFRGPVSDLLSAGIAIPAMSVKVFSS